MQAHPILKTEVTASLSVRPVESVASMPDTGVIAQWQREIERAFSDNSAYSLMDRALVRISRLAGYAGLMVGYCLAGYLIFG